MLNPPITFAHRGASAHAQENTIEAFELALRLGASGLESDVWLTADGVCVCDHDGQLRRGLRRRPFSELRRSELPDHVPELRDLLALAPPDVQVSLDVKDPTAGAATIALAEELGTARRTWLCHPDLDQLSSWRELSADIRLVNSTRRHGVKEGLERRAAELAERDIDALNLHHTDWTGGLTTLLHRFERFAFGWDAQFERVLRDLVWMGVDGVFSDHVDRMVETVAAEAG